MNRIRPVCLILDTINDGYESNQRFGDISQLSRKVVKTFQNLVSPGCFVFLHHERKTSPFSKVKAEDDQDAFSGPAGWETPVATSIRLLGQGNADFIKAKFSKTRLGPVGFSELKLNRNQYGFFEPEISHQEMLLLWPMCIPKEERDEVLAQVQSLSDVYRDIEQRTDATFDAIRKAHQRGRAQGVRYPWEALVSQGQEEP